MIDWLCDNFSGNMKYCNDYFDNITVIYMYLMTTCSRVTRGRIDI